MSHHLPDSPHAKYAKRLSARQGGRIVSVLSGEGPEAESCSALVEEVTGMACADLAADEAANTLSDWVDRAPGRLAPLLLIDEPERVLAHLPHCFFERLRGMLGRLCLVFATRREIGDIPREDHLTSPLLNRLEVQRLGLLEAAGVDALIGLGDGVLSAADGRTMREWAGRHPFYLCLLGHYLWDARRHGEKRLTTPTLRHCCGPPLIHPHIIYPSSLNVTRLISPSEVSPCSTFLMAD